jgi:phosphatidylserine decarboxylase
MKIHKELKSGVIFIIVFFAVIYVAIAQIAARNILLFNITAIVIVVIFCFILFFFRNPSRKIFPDNNLLLAPADGKIVAIDEVYETEFLERRCIKVSIFMSILDVHVNRYPISGTIIYSKYHPGKYYIAKYPKSSKFNEHQTVVIERSDGELIMVKQIAGIVARRIVCYAMIGKNVEQGDDMGFIKFGSRVDMFVPMNTTVRVKINEIVRGNITIIGYISK